MTTTMVMERATRRIRFWIILEGTQIRSIHDVTQVLRRDEGLLTVASFRKELGNFSLEPH